MKLIKKTIAPRNGGEMKPLRKMATLPSRRPLAFVHPAADPFAGGLPTDPEERLYAEADGLRKSFYERVQAERALTDEVSKTDYYLVICFEHGTQADAFLRGAGYPDLGAAYIDGTILAERLEIELPKSPIKLKPPRLPDRTLARLVTGFKARVSAIRKSSITEE